MERRQVSDDAPTVAAVGILAATLAAMCHETLGHGLGCVSVGGHIALLTSIWFRCSGGSAITSAGGPIANLVAGIAALTLLRHHRLSPRVELLVLMFGALNLFWFLGQLAFGSLTNSDDWHYTASQMGWSWIWRPIGTLAGIASYAILIGWLSAVTRKHGSPRAHPIRLAYGAAVISAIIAGLMWRPEPMRSALEGFLTLGVSPLGLLGIARRMGQADGHNIPAEPVRRSWVWIFICTAIFSLFLFVQARGLGSMA